MPVTARLWTGSGTTSNVSVWTDANTINPLVNSGVTFPAVHTPIWYPAEPLTETPYVDGIACCNDCDDALEANHFRISFQESVYRLTRVGSTRVFERCPYCGYRQ